MQTRTRDKSGLEVSSIGLGCRSMSFSCKYPKDLGKRTGF
jgi:aryl-alcohol dehydrogenase-like predicted oxidoreductase